MCIFFTLLGGTGDTLWNPKLPGKRMDGGLPAFTNDTGVSRNDPSSDELCFVSIPGLHSDIRFDTVLRDFGRRSKNRVENWVDNRAEGVTSRWTDSRGLFFTYPNKLCREQSSTNVSSAILWFGLTFRSAVD